jgi:hypothetical protein
MTGTEPHAPRGTAGRGTNWDRGAAWAVRGPRRSCMALYEAAPPAVGSTGTIGRGRAAEASRRRMRISAPPAARPLLGSRAVRGPEELELLDPEWTYTSTHAHLGTAGRGTRKGTVGPAWDAGWPEELRDSEWPRGCRMARSKSARGRRRRDVHASTRSSRGPCTANGPGRAHSRRCRLIVQRRAAPAWSARGPRSQLGPRPAVPRGACGSVPVTRSRRWRSESGFRAVRHGPW